MYIVRLRVNGRGVLIRVGHKQGQFKAHIYTNASTPMLVRPAFSTSEANFTSIVRIII